MINKDATGLFRVKETGKIASLLTNIIYNSNQFLKALQNLNVIGENKIKNKRVNSNSFNCKLLKLIKEGKAERNLTIQELYRAETNSQLQYLFRKKVNNFIINWNFKEKGYFNNNNNKKSCK